MIKIYIEPVLYWMFFCLILILGCVDGWLHFAWWEFSLIAFGEPPAAPTNCQLLVEAVWTPGWVAHNTLVFKAESGPGPGMEEFWPYIWVKSTELQRKEYSIISKIPEIQIKTEQLLLVCFHSKLLKWSVYFKSSGLYAVILYILIVYLFVGLHIFGQLNLVIYHRVWVIISF